LRRSEHLLSENTRTKSLAENHLLSNDRQAKTLFMRLKHFRLILGLFAEAFSERFISRIPEGKTGGCLLQAAFGLTMIIGKGIFMKLTNYLKTAVCLVATASLLGCTGTQYSRSAGRYIDDSATTARVKSALAKDSLVKATEINVSTFRGNVHLTGFVDHPVQKDRASQIARNVEGVEWFKNDILVKNELPNSQVSGQRMEEPSGAVRETQQRGFFGRSSKGGASGLSGSGWQKGTANVYETETAGASNDLTQRIRTQLRNDSPQAQNIRIETSPDGNVTLRGTVSSRDEKNSIEKQVEAISGVKDVDNKLEVQTP
jgi:osmotically-inducible protein OsmY